MKNKLLIPRDFEFHIPEKVEVEEESYTIPRTQIAPQKVLFFRNCNGDVLCGGGGFIGLDNCAEYKIKDKRKLIYEQKP